MKPYFLLLCGMISYSCIASNMISTQDFFAKQFLAHNFMALHHDTLVCQRVLLDSRIKSGENKLSKNEIIKLYISVPEAKRTFKKSNYIMAGAGLFTLSGSFLTVNALKGKPGSKTIEGIDYNYTVRSLPKLLSGLVLTGTGLCLIEFSNELKHTSVEIYNSQKLGLTNRSITIKSDFGLFANGNIGLKLSF